MDLETCRLDMADTIATVTIDRPPVNAQNRRMREEFIWLMDSLSDRDDVRAVVLTGAGKTFSAGADIKERRGLEQGPGDYIAHNRITREFFFAAADCAKPVICAVNGPAIGAGFALALYCDIVVAADDAWVRMPEIDVGLAGGGRLMMDRLGRSWARLIYFTGRQIAASELYRLGVISACVPGEKLMDEAMGLAREIAAKSPMTVKLVKRGFQAAEGMPARDAYRYEQTITHDLASSRDTKEAQAAFLEKRKVNHGGRD
jgi:enoyl-CoA hydratase